MASEPLNPDISDMPPPPSPPPTPESTPSAPEPSAKQEKGYFPPKPISRLKNKKILVLSLISIVTTTLLILFILSRGLNQDSNSDARLQQSGNKIKSSFRIIMEEIGLAERSY